jgi:uncharacterized membrane protein YqjE
MAEQTGGTAATPARIPVEGVEIENLPTLISRLGDEVMQLVDTKINLFKVEIREDIRAYERYVALMATGAVIASLGFGLLNVAVAFFVSRLFSFSQPVNYALGFVLTGVLYLIVGGILIMWVKNKMAKRDLVPNRSVEELRKDKKWLKNEI